MYGYVFISSLSRGYRLAQEITKQFRHGKEFSKDGENNFGCVSINDSPSYVDANAKEKDHCSMLKVLH